jgi:hypothetical protein
MEVHPGKGIFMLTVGLLPNNVPDPGRPVWPQASLKRTALEIPQQAFPLMKGSIIGDWLTLKDKANA